MLEHKATVSPGGEKTKECAILLAEDSMMSRMLEQSILQSGGYLVTAVEDGARAWTELQTFHYDLVVTDIEMPKLDGLSLLLRIRADARMAKLPVVVVSSLDSPADQKRLTEAGANAIFSKGTMDPEALLRTVAEFL